MKPEDKARVTIDKKLIESGWTIQDVKSLNLSASLGIAVREFPTSTGPVDYALFLEGIPVGVIEAKKSELGENITSVESQSARYTTSTFKWIKNEYRIRFAYEATDKLTRFTDYDDIKYRSRTVFSFHRPETLLALLKQPDTIRNNMKRFPEFDPTGFRKCQITAIENLDASFADNRPKALVQMATGAGKTFTAITAAYRLLKYGKMNRILFLVDTKGLGEQAEREFLAYKPTDDPRPFSQIYGVHRLKSSYIPDGVQICISTIQRMYSILKGEELNESSEEISFNEYVTADSKAPKEVVYNEKYPPEFFDCINDYYPRIAVTVDMIATGTDVKPIECLIFMRDVRSKNYFEQMKGRGTRTLSKDDLQKVTPSATDNKDHFVIVDAVGVTKSKKSDTRTLERKPSVSMRELMMNVALGDKSEDTLTSLANRLIRLNAQMTTGERKTAEEMVDCPVGKIAERLLNAFDEDVILTKARTDTGSDDPSEEQLASAKKELLNEAVTPFNNPDFRNYLEITRRSHEQVIDNVNLDEVLFAGFDSQQEENADRVISSFRQFIDENRDEIIALRIIYDQKYKDRPMAIDGLKALYEKLKSKGITVERLWDCYAIKKPERVKRGTMAQLSDLISIIRFEMGYTENLAPFADRVNYNFMQWTLRRNAGAVHFTDEQMEWLRLVKDHIAVSLSIETSDLDLNPFDRKGGLGRFYEVFGDQYEAILMEMNVELVA